LTWEIRALLLKVSAGQAALGNGAPNQSKRRAQYEILVSLRPSGIAAGG
jgi:hypothetical protein